MGSPYRTLKTVPPDFNDSEGNRLTFCCPCFIAPRQAKRQNLQQVRGLPTSRRGIPRGPPSSSVPTWRQLFRLCWIPTALPCVPTTLQGIDVRVSSLHQRPRQTGAGVFVRSGAIQDDSLPLGKVLRPLADFIRVDSCRAGDTGVRGVPVPIGSDIQNRDISLIEP